MKTADYVIVAVILIWFCIAVWIIIKNRGRCGCCGAGTGGCGACKAEKRGHLTCGEEAGGCKACEKCGTGKNCPGCSACKADSGKKKFSGEILEK